jgi:hypothetical protein
MMSPRFRITAVLFVVALLVAALASSAALAASRIEVGSRVTLATSDPFHGKVLSKRDACERNRTVAVFVVREGADGLYGTTKSNSLGEWSIPAGTPHGDFYAVAKVRSIDKGTTTLVCKRATSSTVTF